MNKNKKIIPIIDCPICNAKDVPLSYGGTFTKPGCPTVTIWTCTNCGKVPNVANDVQIKRYVSIAELEELGWSQK